MEQPIRILVVDDSAYIRYTIAKHLENEADLTVIGHARDGVEALHQTQTLKPDVIILDVEMPQMDGLTALQHIMRRCPTPIIMLSGLTQPGTRTTIRALMRGAVDFVSKPAGQSDIQTVIHELAAKIRTAVNTPKTFFQPLKANKTGPIAPKLSPQPYDKGDPLIVIAASTGGPRALEQLLSALPADLPAGILVVQHMPPDFTRSLAQRLNTTSHLTVQEAANGDRLARGTVLIAPGNFHLCLSNFRRVVLDSGPRRQHVRPSADVTMASVVNFHSSNVIGVVLTGMGQDGTEGSGQIKSKGGRIIAEHQSTSVVYGMPASVVKAGFADLVLPLPEIAPALLRLIAYESS